MTVEIEGIYLKALEKIADKYNKQTLELWDKGKSFYLRKKESASTILPSVILEHLRKGYPDLYAEIIEELETKIQELSEQKSKSADLHNELSLCLSQKIEIKEEMMNNSLKEESKE